MFNTLLVGLGGFAGSILRFAVNTLAQKIWPHPFFPYGTLTVNIAGCLLIGLLGGLFETRQMVPAELRLLLIAGFLGGFTTFSSFGYELFSLARAGQFIPALIHAVLHLTLGFSAVWLGFILSRAG